MVLKYKIISFLGTREILGKYRPAALHGSQASTHSPVFENGLPRVMQCTACASKCSGPAKGNMTILSVRKRQCLKPKEITAYKQIVGQAWWLTAIIPVTQEVKVGRISVRGQSRQKINKNPVSTIKLGVLICTCDPN
jgi:hypothetical protein